MFLKSNKKSDQRDLIISYKKLFNHPEGKEVLFDLINRFHVLNTHGGDAFKEGQRSTALYIMRQCNINLEHFDRLCKGELNGNDIND